MGINGEPNVLVDVGITVGAAVAASTCGAGPLVVDVELLPSGADFDASADMVVVFKGDAEEPAGGTGPACPKVL